MDMDGQQPEPKDIVKYAPLDLVEGKDSKELCEVVLKEFQNVPQGMTKFQIQKFVVCEREFPTAASKYWQSKLELWVRLQSVIQMHFDYRKRAARIKELKALIFEAHERIKTANSGWMMWKWEAVAERHTIEIEENEFAMMVIRKTVVDKLKEMHAFNEVKKNTEEKLGVGALDDRELSEEEFWAEKAEINAELKLRFPEVFNVSRQEYDKLVRSQRQR